MWNFPVPPFGKEMYHHSNGIKLQEEGVTGQTRINHIYVSWLVPFNTSKERCKMIEPAANHANYVVIFHWVVDIYI